MSRYARHNPDQPIIHDYFTGGTVSKGLPGLHKTQEKPMKNETTKPQKFIIRTKTAGTYFAEIISRDGQEAVLGNARLLYYWSGAKSLLQIAKDGINKDSKVTVSIPTMTVLEVERFIPCSDKATAIIEALPEWKQ